MFSKDRRAEYKRGIDSSDQRRKREETSVELRKNKRDEHLAKRRATESVDPSDENNKNANSAVDQKATVAQLPALVEGLKAQTVADVVNSLKTIRKMLSIVEKPPIEAVMKSGALPLVVGLVNAQSPSEVLFEAAWVITNIASGSTEHVQAIAKSGVISRFVAILGTTNMPNVTGEVQDQVAWALGNIAGDCTNARNFVLDQGVMKPLLALVEARLVGKNARLRDAVWVLSNMCRGKPQPDFEKVRCAIPVLAKVLRSGDEEVLTDACWALSYLSDDSTPTNIKIESVRNTGCVPRLVELLLHDAKNIRVPALRTLGNLVTGNDQQTETVLSCNFIQALIKLLNGNKKAVRKEVCWALSNIAAGPSHQIQRLIDSTVLRSLADLLPVSEFEIRKEITWVFSNIAAGGEDEQLKYLCSLPLATGLVEQLKMADTTLLTTTLDVLAAMLRASQLSDSQENAVAVMLERCGGLDALDELQRHQLPAVHKKASELLEKYFEAPEDDGVDIGLAPAVASGSSQFMFGDAPASSSSFGSAGGPAMPQEAFIFN